MRKTLLLLLFAVPAMAQQNIGTVSIDPIQNTVTCAQSTASNLKVDLSGTGANSTAVKTDGSAVTQPVSGTVTCNAGTGTLTVGGAAADGAAVSGNPVRVAAKDGSGNTQDVLSGTDGRLDVNLGQVAGATVQTGNGTASGAQRVSLASDSTGQVKVLGQNSIVPIFCDSAAVLNMTSATTTQIIAASGSTVIYVCSYAIHVSGANNVKLVRGTGSNCGTGTTDVSVTWKFGAADTGINRSGGNGIVAKGAASGALCVTTSAAAAADIEVSYAQF